MHWPFDWPIDRPIEGKVWILESIATLQDEFWLLPLY